MVDTDHLNPEDVGSTPFWNTDIQPPRYTAQRPIKSRILSAELIFLALLQRMLLGQSLRTDRVYRSSKLMSRCPAA
jgi:hypothetical protein